MPGTWYLFSDLECTVILIASTSIGPRESILKNQPREKVIEAINSGSASQKRVQPSLRWLQNDYRGKQIRGITNGKVFQSSDSQAGNDSWEESKHD